MRLRTYPMALQAFPALNRVMLVGHSQAPASARQIGRIGRDHEMAPRNG
jgi:hypothetical protein